jgi:perosamine synthetase
MAPERRDPPIPVFRPSYGEEELRLLEQVLKSGWVGQGPKVGEFEAKMASYLGVKHAVAVNSCTAALHLAMMALDLRESEVITTPMTFVSTNHAILYVGGTPVFCDIERDTLNIDAAKIDALITPRTRAIVCVHYGGHACDLEALQRIAVRHQLKLVEDVAHGCGGEWCGRKLGSIGDVGCFSFHAVKNLATGDGGLVTTNDSALFERLKRLRWMGITRDTWQRGESHYTWEYDVVDVGYKYQMCDIIAAIGLAQFGKLEAGNARRRQIADRYRSALGDLPWLELPVQRKYATVHARHNFVIHTDSRDALNQHLLARGISTGVHYIPNNHYAMYRPCRGPTPVTEKEWKRLLTLPLFPALTDEDVEFIVKAIREFRA